MHMITCPFCCSSNVELRNENTYVCLSKGHTFNLAALHAGRWIDSDRWLRHVELEQGPVVGMRDEPRPLNYDGGAKLAWLTGHIYEHRSDGTTWLWVTEDCFCN